MTHVRAEVSGAIKILYSNHKIHISIIPVSIRLSTSVNMFKTHLKTYLFDKAFAAL